MNSCSDPKLAQFVDRYLNYCKSEAEINDCCIKFVKSTSYQQPDKAVSYAASLIGLIFDWGFYPTELISFCTVFKYKQLFDELASTEKIERIVQVLVALLEERPPQHIAKVYLKLLSVQRFQGLQDKALIGKTIDVCLNLAGFYVSIDTLCYIVLTKFSLKVSECIRESKHRIADVMIKCIFMFFSNMRYNSFRKEMVFTKVYLCYLKILITLGNEITMVAQDQAMEGQISPLQLELFSIFSKVMIFNLQLSAEKDATEFSSQNVQYNEIVQNKIFKDSISFMDSCQKCDYTINSHSFSQIHFETPHEADMKETDTDNEIIEKVKINSLKLLMVVVRQLPQVFLNRKFQNSLYPHIVEMVDIKQLSCSKEFIPLHLYTKSYLSMMKERGELNNVKASLSFKKARSSAAGAAAQPLANYKKQYLAKINENKPFGHCSLISSLLGETKMEIKSTIIEAISVIQDLVYRRIYSIHQKQSEADPKECSLSEIKNTNVRLLTVFLLELYSAKPMYFKYILEGLSHCPPEAMLVLMPNSLVVNLIDNFIIPIVKTCLHLNFEFLTEFEKFITATFEAGFSEYFISKIDYLKEIILKNLSWYASTQEPDASFLPKLKVYFTLIDQLYSAFPNQMIDILPFLVNFYTNNLFYIAKYSPLHFYLPLLLGKIVQHRKELLLNSIGKNQCFVTDDVYLLAKQPPTSHFKCKEEPSRENTCQYRNAKAEYLSLDRLVKQLYPLVLSYPKQHMPQKDRFENALVNTLIGIPKMQSNYLNHIAAWNNYVSVEDCLLAYADLIKNKKNRLQLLNYYLSDPELAMPALRKHLWNLLFQMFVDKVLSVEIVFTNYNIIYGLRNNQELFDDETIVRIFVHSASSLRSKNRKLINNCLKIFGQVFAHYSFSILGWILDLEVPNVFADELEGIEAKKPNLPCVTFLQIVFGKFINHKYSKFNLITLNSISQIIKRHENRPELVSQRLMKLVFNLTPQVAEKISRTDSYRIMSVGMDLIQKREAIEHLKFPILLELLISILKFMELKSESSSLRSSEEVSGEAEYLSEVQNKSLDFVVLLEDHMCRVADGSQLKLGYAEFFKGKIINNILEQIKIKFQQISAKQFDPNQAPRPEQNGISSSSFADESLAKLRFYGPFIRRLRKFIKRSDSENEIIISMHADTLLTNLSRYVKYMRSHDQYSTDRE
jgi:hypothetical protein